MVISVFLLFVYFHQCVSLFCNCLGFLTLLYHKTKFLTLLDVVAYPCFMSPSTVQCDGWVVIWGHATRYIGEVAYDWYSLHGRDQM